VTDEQRIDAFFERLMNDPNFIQFAVLLGPHRVMLGPAVLVEFIESFIAHWQATAPTEKVA
jgi:tripartite-type tricarboxylate transporter receptor subunit TctC